MPTSVQPSASIRSRFAIAAATLLFVVLALFGSGALWEVRKNLVAAGFARVEGAASQIAATMGNSSRQRVREIEQLAAEPALREFVSDPSESARVAAAAVLDKVSAAPTAPLAALTGADGRLLLVSRSNASEDQTPQESLPGLTLGATGISPLRQIGDRMFFDTVARVEPSRAASDADAAADPVYVVIRRVVAVNAAVQFLQSLIGDNSSLLIGNRDASLWTDLASPVPGPPADLVARSSGDYVSEAGERRLGAAVPISDSPWTVWIDLPREGVLGPADVFLRGMLLAGAGFTVLGAFLAWVAARRLTTPIEELTKAAEAIASGNVSRRVETRGGDEVGRLASAFNIMAATVESDMHELETRVEARTRELDAALQNLRTTQDELVRNEKLATLGQLASGVGHELRNPLGVMTNAIYYLEMIQPDADPEVREYLQIVRSQIGLSERIVSDLLDFARVKPPQRQLIPPQQIVSQQLSRLGPTEGIAVHQDFPPDLPSVYVDPVQVGQVVLNLLVNAIQSMEDRPNATLTLRGRVSDGQVRLEVTDTGIGMAHEVQQKIFEALFTTKARGIGLGLAVSRKLAEANGAQLTLLTSQPDAGSTFTVTLPVAEGL